MYVTKREKTRETITLKLKIDLSRGQNLSQILAQNMFKGTLFFSFWTKNGD